VTISLTGGPDGTEGEVMNAWNQDGRSVFAAADGLHTPSEKTLADKDVGGNHGSGCGACTSDAEIFDVDSEIGFMIRRVHQRISSIFQERMKTYDLTPPQFSSLCKMAEQGEVSQNQLGRLVNLDPATNQGVVRRLMKRGLIDRRDDPNDRRRSLLSLTDSGRELLAACMPAAKRVSPAVMKPLNEEEQKQLLAMLKRLS